jgi:hypothetical protein
MTRRGPHLETLIFTERKLQGCSKASANARACFPRLTVWSRDLTACLAYSFQENGSDFRCHSDSPRGPSRG